MFKKIRYEIGWRISVSCARLMIFMGEKTKNPANKIYIAKEMLEIINEHPEVDKILRENGNIDLAVKANDLLRYCCDIRLEKTK